MIRPARWVLLSLAMFLLLGLAGWTGPQPPAAGKLAILLTNDDGYGAPGLRAMAEGLQTLGEVWIAAPAEDYGGKGHSVMLHDPILVDEKGESGGAKWYAIHAPPATCVRLAVESLLPRRPDLVVSGINRGDNLGITVYHSGTVGGAREAAIVGVPAIAVSIRGDDAKDYQAAATFIRQLVEKLRAAGLLKPGLFLNVNVPAGERKGVRMAQLSTKPRHDTFERRTNPRRRVYFWPDFQQRQEDDEGTDVAAFVRGYITITPMTLDATDTGRMEALRILNLETPATR
ncbi:MAG: 5'/3'-nucleotidase SurE [Terriglobales bacterium]